MTDESGMIGEPPSARYSAVPKDPAEHAVRIAREWRDVAEGYVRKRMQELGIPDAKIGEPDRSRNFKSRAFDPDGRVGGNISSGITVNSGVLNPDLLKGEKGGRLWRRATLRDRFDAIIAHEWEESITPNHQQAIRNAAKTLLPVTDGAKRILRAMAR